MNNTKYLLLSVTFLFQFIKSQLPNYQSLYTSSLTCEMGRLQSPLDLNDINSNFNSTININYFDYNTIPNAYLGFSQDGRILQVNQLIQTPASGNFGYVGLSRNGVLKQYALIRIEFNTPAEHQINGTTYDLEVKFVHKKVLPFETNVNQYRRISDGNQYLIISIIYSLTGNATDNGFIADLAATYYADYNPNYKYQSVNLDINSYDLFREKRWFFYEGSFTSFPCDETVNYIVIRDPFAINDVTLFQTIYSKVYSSSNVAKPISDSYGRSIYRNYMNLTEILSGKMLSTNLLLLLSSILLAMLI